VQAQVLELGSAILRVVRGSPTAVAHWERHSDKTAIRLPEHQCRGIADSHSQEGLARMALSHGLPRGVLGDKIPQTRHLLGRTGFVDSRMHLRMIRKVPWLQQEQRRTVVARNPGRNWVGSQGPAASH
jgi:hypothetical protein